MNANEPKSSCSGNGESGPTALVYACSGASDTGALADRAARRLDAEDKAWMSCLAGIGARASGLMASAAAAPALLAIDGCPQDCAWKTLELAGFTNVRHVRVTDLGFKKGGSPITYEAITAVAASAVSALNPPA